MFGKGIGWPEIVLLLAVVLLLFGAKRLPDTARGLGRSLRIFKAETKGLTDDDASPEPLPQSPEPPAVIPVAPPVEMPIPPPINPAVSSPAHPPVSAPAHPAVSSPAHPPVAQPEVTTDPGGQR